MKRFSAIGVVKVLGLCQILSSCGDPVAVTVDGGFGREAVLVDAARSVAADGAPAPAPADAATTATAEAGAAASESGPTGATAGVACGAARDCASGFCVDGVCCDTACDGACRSCGLAARPGACSPVLGAPDPGSCAGEQICGSDGECGSALGIACARSGDCASGACVDGVCCGSSACGTCQACNLAGSVGSCAPVAPMSDDADSGCSGATTCDGVGGCKQKNGRTCLGAGACASGFCADGACCDQACGQTCHACAEPGHEGTCVVVAGRDDDVATTACGGGTSTCDAAGAGTCKLEEGVACAHDGDCAFGACRTYYRDADGDGYGVPAAPIIRCDRAPNPPPGYGPRAGDCCDLDANVHPAQTAFFATPSACGGYDHDCDGLVELQHATCVSVTKTLLPTPACGLECVAGVVLHEPVVAYQQLCR